MAISLGILTQHFQVQTHFITYQFYLHFVRCFAQLEKPEKLRWGLCMTMATADVNIPQKKSHCIPVIKADIIIIMYCMLLLLLLLLLMIIVTIIHMNITILILNGRSRATRSLDICNCYRLSGSFGAIAALPELRRLKGQLVDVDEEGVNQVLRRNSAENWRPRKG